MAGEAQMVYTISKQALRLVKSGKAVISSGGVRTISGQMVELARPAIGTVVRQGMGGLLSPVAAASSIVGNIQNVAIQRGVNQANAKLDTSLAALEHLTQSVGALSAVPALSWVNCAFGLVNCGISLAGFSMVLHKIKDLSRQIDALRDIIEREIFNECYERFERYSLYIRTDTGTLLLEDKKVTDRENIVEHLDEIAAYLAMLTRKYERCEIPATIGSEMLFGLAGPFSEIIRAYSAQYYYETGKWPPNYNHWWDVIRSACGDGCRNRLKESLYLDAPDATMEKRYIAYSGATYPLMLEQGNMAFTEKVVDRMEQGDFLHIENYLTERIAREDYLTGDEFGDTRRICIPVA